jgi:hypothetical protein
LSGWTSSLVFLLPGQETKSKKKKIKKAKKSKKKQKGGREATGRAGPRDTVE